MKAPGKFESTALGRWLATRFGFFQRRWVRRMRAHLAAEAMYELSLARDEVAMMAALYVAHLGEPEEEDRSRSDLISAVCRFRNASAALAKRTS